MGYESPITITEIAKDISERVDSELCERTLRVIETYGIEVDKAELLKALAYDRGQYDKGYSDGYNGGYEDGKAVILERLRRLIEDEG